jgi:uncharacterized membrane protein
MAQLKMHKSKTFNERHTKATSSIKKQFSGKNGDTTVVLTILVALFIIGILLVNLALEPPQEERFDVIYLLDSEKQTSNFPETVVLGENSTFTLWVGVENQRGATMNYSVLLKIDDGTSAIGDSQVEAKESFNKTLQHEEVWEFQVTVNIDQPGHNRLLFELWYIDATANMSYTGSWVNLSVEAT